MADGDLHRGQPGVQAQDRPLLVQIGRFTRSADPLGVVNAYRLVKKHHPVRLVVAGTAGDDPESSQIVAELRRAAEHDPDIFVRDLPPDAHRQINALQRAATALRNCSSDTGFPPPREAIMIL